MPFGRLALCVPVSHGSASLRHVSCTFAKCPSAAWLFVFPYIVPYFGDDAKGFIIKYLRG